MRNFVLGVLAGIVAVLLLDELLAARRQAYRCRTFVVRHRGQ